MSASGLIAMVLGLESTKSLRIDLAVRGVLRDFSPLIRSDELAPVDWSQALLRASALTSADEAVAQDLSLRIAQSCLLSDDALEHHRDAAAVMLERLGNLPSLRLAVERGRIGADALERVPAPLQLDVVRRRLELAIPVEGGDVISGNPFQRRLWSAVENASWVSVSAPTSAGKSYIVRRWFEDRVAHKDQFLGIYVVPTRALIDEVSVDLTVQLAEAAVAVFTLPWDKEIAEHNRKILVVTQERLHLLQQRLPNMKADLLFVDEAQKFGDDARGVLLQQTIEETARRSPEVQVVFASPLSSNPEMLLEGATSGATTEWFSSETITVNQNLLWADQVPRHPKRWGLRVVIDGEAVNVGEFDLPARAHPESQRLPLVAVTLGAESGGNVVYVNGPSDAEKAANQIYDALGPEGDISADTGVVDLRELVQRTIHNQYALAKVLQRGIAFHYGNMPQIVRSEIEALFRNGTLKFLVCTATLLEGVNLPCRNLFARNPKKGNGNPMNAADFWNLAGRAGRWGKEFQGNIFCIDANRSDRWPELPTRRTLQPMTRATTAALRDVETVITYVEAGAPLTQAGEDSMLEPVYSYLATKLASGEDLVATGGLSVEDAARLTSAIEQADASLEIPPEMIRQHAGISPAAMQRLLNRFRANDAGAAYQLPLPESEDALEVYCDALRLSKEELGAKFGESARQYALGLLILTWMRGLPLALIIQRRISYLQRSHREVKLPNEIRDVMRDVEQVARFQAPKYLSCYTDVLRLHLEQQGHESLDDVPDISMMLELGVSRVTEVSLMALGLSRTSAIALSEFIIADDLSREAARQWVIDHPEIRGGLPVLIRREIDRTLDNRTS